MTDLQEFSTFAEQLADGAREIIRAAAYQPFET